ncbi:MAG: hypothetical protein ACJASR_002115 [Psychroserpens sp.]|jgi:hypothetical protein
MGNFRKDFREKFMKYKKRPRSKRKSFVIGFTTAVGIFGLTLFGPALSAVAKDVPKNLKPGDIAPPPVPAPAPSLALPPSKQVISTGISGVAGSVCALAVTSGSFAVGIACGCVVVVGILQLQAK